MKELLAFLIIYCVLVFLSFLGGIILTVTGIVIFLKAKKNSDETMGKFNKKSAIILMVIGGIMLVFVVLNLVVPVLRELLFSIMKFGG